MKMPLPRLILVETKGEANLGAAIRVAANFGHQALHLVRPKLDLSHQDIADWACGAQGLVRVHQHDTLSEAAAGVDTLVATASARGRPEAVDLFLPQLGRALSDRGSRSWALVFGNESIGLIAEDLDRCDLVIQIPTDLRYPTVNLAQSLAICTAWLHLGPETHMRSELEPQAERTIVDGFLEDTEALLSQIGYLDPVNPHRVMKQFRDLLSRAAASEREVRMLRGILRQARWALENSLQDS